MHLERWAAEPDSGSGSDECLLALCHPKFLSEENSVAKTPSSIRAGPAAGNLRATDRHRSDRQIGDRHAAYDKARLFLVSVIALVTAGIAASIRGNLAAVLQHQFLDPIDPVHSAQMIGTVLGVAFFGFALTIMIGSPLLDYLGMRPLMALSSICFIVGTLIVIFAAPLSAWFSAYRVLWTGALISGIGWGLTETVINPLAVTLYPDDQTHRLNLLHAWWPGGLIVGGLIGAGLSKLTVDWRLQMACVLVPAVTFGVASVHQQIPTNRAGGRRDFDRRNDQGVLSPVFPGVVFLYVPHRSL